MIIKNLKIGKENKKQVRKHLREEYQSIENMRGKIIVVMDSKGFKYKLKIIPTYVADLKFLYLAYGVVSWASNEQNCLFCECDREGSHECIGMSWD